MNEQIKKDNHLTRKANSWIKQNKPELLCPIKEEIEDSSICYHSRYGHQIGAFVPFTLVEDKIPAGYFKRARVLRDSFPPYMKDCASYEALDALLTCPDGWASQPTPSLVKTVLDRAEEILAPVLAKKDEVDALLEEIYQAPVSEWSQL